DAQMQAIARELSVSETAFRLPSEDAGRCLRYFTPEREIDLCGHATVAMHAELLRAGEIEPGKSTFMTSVGILEVEVTSDGMIWMAQQSPTVQDVNISPETVANALGISSSGIMTDIPIARSSTGLPFLIVPITYLEILGEMAPDYSAIEQLADEHEAAGIYAATFDTLSSRSTVHARCFVPGAGIPEDPVTGTASGACAGYLDWSDALGEELSRSTAADDALVFEQGNFIDRAGRVHVRMDGDNTPWVGGTAVTSLSGELSVPVLDTDDVIEA
ncbi:MAG: PhzF family phenazine biosynthesis protein, partial [Halobacteriaceae archaeon]